MMFADTSRGRAAAKDPAVVKWKGMYYLYYSMLPGTDAAAGYDIGIASSHDMERWTKIGELGREGDVERNGICAPGAIVLDGTLHLFYQSYGNGPKDAICHAYSTDGVRFTRDKTNPVFRPTGAWNNGRAIDADVARFGDFLYLYCATRDPQGEIQMLCAARAPLYGGYGRDRWKQCSDAPLLKPEMDWEQQCIEAPAVIVRDDTVFMFYAGAYNNRPQQIGIASSTDGVHFTRMQDTPFLQNGAPGAWNACESGHPYVFEDDDGRVYLFYQGNNDGGRTWYIARAELLYENGRFRLAE